MFENPGRIIKSAAKVAYGITAVLSVGVGIYYMGYSYRTEAMGLWILVGGVFGSFASMIFNVAFGELV